MLKAQIIKDRAKIEPFIAPAEKLKKRMAGSRCPEPVDAMRITIITKGGYSGTTMFFRDDRGEGANPFQRLHDKIEETLSEYGDLYIGPGTIINIALD